MKDIGKTSQKVIGSLVQRGQSALELGKTKTTIAEYLRLSGPVFEEDAKQGNLNCVWVEEERSPDREDLYPPPNQELLN